MSINGSRIKCFPDINDLFEMAIWEQVDDEGCYSPDTNIIYILEIKHLYSTISHEFLHMLLHNWIGQDASKWLDIVACKNKIDYSGLDLI